MSFEKPRPVVERFLQLKNKLAVLDKAKNLKGSGIFINEDFPEAVRQKKEKNLFQQRRQLVREVMLLI